MWTKTATDEERRIILPITAFKILILGNKLADTEKAEILKLANDNFPNIEIKIANKINAKIQITSATNKW
jgi:hypothetical protein